MDVTFVGLKVDVIRGSSGGRNLDDLDCACVEEEQTKHPLRIVAANIKHWRVNFAE